MITAVLDGKIEKVGPDYIWWRSGDDKRQVNFADNFGTTKEDWAASFRHLVGKRAVIPVDGPFFIAVDFLPGVFEETIRVIQAPFPVASVEKL